MSIVSVDPVAVARELGERFAEGAAERDARRRPPDEEMRLLKASGLLALFVPREHGGLDADYRTATAAVAAIAEGDPNLAHIPQAHHCGIELLKFVGAQELQARFFPRVVEQGHLLPSAYVDEGRGHRIDEVAVPLRRDGDGYRLSGGKTYVTGSRWGDAFYAPVVTEPDPADPRLRGVANALVWCDADAPGVHVDDDWDAMGQRTTATGSVTFDDVAIDGDRVMPADMAADVPHNHLGSHAQIIFCAIHVGVARAAQRDAVAYLREQGRPWIHSSAATAVEDPYVLHQVGDLDVAVDAAEAVLERAADALDHARRTALPADRDAAAVAVSRAKALSTEVTLRMTNELFQLCGTGSTRGRWAFDRHWRNMRTLTLHDPVAYKYALVGDWVLNGTAPPISGWS